MKEALLNLMKTESAQGPVPSLEIAEIMGNAALLGLVLTVSTYFLRRYIDRSAESPKDTLEFQLKEIVGAHNLLFISVGLCGIMLLISNSLLRAFAIIAALAIVRFRVKLDNKSLGSAMLFAILSGMACGAREPGIAYVTVGIFLTLAGLLALMVKIVRSRISLKANTHSENSTNTIAQTTPGVQELPSNAVQVMVSNHATSGMGL